MREYKFRGKRKDRPTEWVYGYFIGSLTPSSDAENNAWITDGYYKTHYVVIPETVGQSSGYKDKNGKEMFEHDIVNVAYGTGKVVFHAGSFMIEWLDDKEANMELLTMEKFKTGHAREDLIVNGNILDNPELLNP